MPQKRNQSTDAATVGRGTMARPLAGGARPLKAQEEIIELPPAISSCSVERGQRNRETGGENQEKNSPYTIHSLGFHNTMLVCRSGRLNRPVPCIFSPVHRLRGLLLRYVSLTLSDSCRLTTRVNI